MNALHNIFLTYDIRSAMRQELFTPLLRNGIKYRDLQADSVVSQFEHHGLDKEFAEQFTREIIRVNKRKNQNGKY